MEQSVGMRGWVWEMEGEEVSGFHTGHFPGLQGGGEGVTTQAVGRGVSMLQDFS